MKILLVLFIIAMSTAPPATYILWRYRKQKLLPKAAPPPTCLAPRCTAWQLLDCGSGYCAEHHNSRCAGRCTPAICKNCQQPWANHVPPKCLFDATTYVRKQ